MESPSSGHRVRRLINVLAFAAVFFGGLIGLRYALLGRWRTGTINLLLVPAGLTAIMMARQVLPGRLPVVLHALTGYVFVSLLAVASFSGQSLAVAPYWITLLPAAVTYALGPKPGLVWAVVCSLGTLGVHISGRLAPIEPDFVPQGFELFSVQIGLLVIFHMFGRSSYAAMEAEVAHAQERAEIMRRESEALAAAAEASADLARRKQAFFAMISHELRSPIHAAQIVAQLLDGSRLDRDQRGLVGDLKTSVGVLHELISDLLDHARIESGEMSLERAPFEIREVVDEALTVVAPAASRKALRFIQRVEPDVPQTARGDAHRLRQVVVNLLANAVKFTDQGRVVVRVARDGEELVVEVEDTGIGIPQEQQSSIFEPFEQVDASIGRRYGGSGLGLSIARRLIEAMEGTIVVDSEPGRGTCFVVRLPLVEAASPATRLIHDALVGRRVEVSLEDEDERVGALEILRRLGVEPRLSGATGGSGDALLTDGEVASGVVDTRSRPCIWVGEGPGEDCVTTPRPLRSASLRTALHQALGVTKEEPQSTGPSLRVLLVDDSAINLSLGERILRQQGHEVVTADGGRAALRAARRAPFDVVLLDLRMPDVDGEVVASELREARGSNRRPMIIGLSADARERTVEAATDAGLDVFLAKPAGPKELQAVLREAAERLGHAKDEPPPERLPADGAALSESASSAPEPDHRGPIVDPKVLEGHVGRIGEDAVTALVELFAESSASTIEGLTVAKESEQWDRMEELAHRLAGSALSLGLGRLGRAATLVEERSRDGEGDLGGAFEALTEAHEATLAALDRHLAK